MAVLAAWLPAAAVALTSQAWTTLARKAVLKRADFPSGWSSMPAPRKVPGLTCDRFHPGMTGIVRRASVASPTFNASANGPFVSQTVYEFDSPGQALTFWRRVVRQRLEECVAESLQRGAGQGVSFAVTGKRRLGLPKISDRDAGYRVLGTATTSLQQVDVFLDMVVLAHGTAVTEISFSSLEQPVDRGFELHLARAVATRLRRASAS